MRVPKGQHFHVKNPISLRQVGAQAVYNIKTCAKEVRGKGFDVVQTEFRFSVFLVWVYFNWLLYFLYFLKGWFSKPCREIH